MDQSPFNVVRLPLQAARSPSRPPRITMCFKFGRCQTYFFPNFSISLPLCHTSGSWREEWTPLVPPPLTSTEKTSEPMFRLPTLNCITRQDAKLSNDVHGCYWSEVFRSFLPLWKRSTGGGGVGGGGSWEKPAAFPCDFYIHLQE